MERLKKEKEELHEKLSKLGSFIGTQKFFELPQRQQGLLDDQYRAMERYYETLALRLDDLEYPLNTAV